MILPLLYLFLLQEIAAIQSDADLANRMKTGLSPIQNILLQMFGKNINAPQLYHHDEFARYVQFDVF